MATDYGTALAFYAAVPALLSYVSGPLAVVYAVVRSWQTPRGALPWAPERGVDLHELLGQPLTDAERAAWVQALMREAEEDERVTSCAVELEETGDALTIRAVIELADGIEIPFRLVVAPASVTVAFLRGAA